VLRAFITEANFIDRYRYIPSVKPTRCCNLADEVLQSSQLTRLQLLAIPYYAQLFVHTEQSDMTPRPKQAGSDLNFGKHTASNIGWMNDFIETFYKLPMVHNGEGKYN